MLKSCKFCGKIHDDKVICDMKPIKKVRYKSKAKEFRNTYEWQLKRDDIRSRDLNICQVCRCNIYRINKPRYNYKNLEVHHIIPIEEDEALSLVDSNLITLCNEHHRLAERGMIPRYILQSIISMNRSDRVNLKVVYGSPCSGKTTYVKEHMKDYDIAIDLDYIISCLSLGMFFNDGRKINPRMKYKFELGNEIKQFIINKVSQIDKEATVYLITTTMNELIEMFTNVEVIEMNKTKEEVIEMLYKSNRKNKQEWKNKIDDWYETYPPIK